MKKLKFLAITIALVLAVGMIAGCKEEADSKDQSDNNLTTSNDEVIEGVNKSLKGTKLYIYNWGEYINPDLIDEFEDLTGIKVIYEMYDTNEIMHTKLMAGGTKYDICIPSDYMIEKLINEEMLLEIDLSNIPNFKYIDSKFTNLPFDSDNRYSVPYFWGTLGILYNKNMVEEVNSWDILWDEKYENNVLMLDSMRDTMGVALKRLGYSVNTKDADQIEQAKQSLIEQRNKEMIYGYYVDEIKDMMINAECALALEWSGDAMDMYWEEIDYIGYAVPDEGSNLWFDSMVIPNTCQNKKGAEMFINYICHPDIAYKNTDYVGYATVITDTYKMVIEDYPEIAENDAYWPKEEVINRCEVFVDLGEAEDLYNDAWNELLLN